MKRLLMILTGVAVLLSLHEVNAQNVEFVASYDTPGSALGVYVTGQFAYVADGDSGLLILDVSEPSNPVPAGSLQTVFPALDVLVLPDYAYVAGGFYFWGGSYGDIEIIDVSDAAAPNSVGFTGGGLPTDFFVSGNYVYRTWNNTIGDSNLQIIDVSQPDSAFLVDYFEPYCMYSEPSFFEKVFVSGNFLYITCTLDLQVWDISDPYNAVEVGTCLLGSAIDIFATGDYAYSADYYYLLRIFNVSNPSDPYYAGSFDTAGPTRDVFVSGNYAYVAERDSGLQIIDVSEPENPVLAGSYDTPGYARRIYVQDDLIYVADTSSLMILRFNPQTEIEEVGDLPRQLALNQNYPNPFNGSTRIEFDIPALSDIDIALYDILGRRVATLFEGQQQPGHHSIVWDAGDIPSGIYFTKLQTGSQTEVIRMTLLK